MRGSLDDPPIVVSGSRWKMALFLLIAVGFTAIGLWQILTEPPLWWAYLSIGFFGLGGVIFAVQLVKPQTLVIAPQGVTWSVPWRTHRYAWRQMANFRPQAVSAFARHVWFDFQKTPGGEVGAGGFGTGWEISAAALSDLLNAARERWGGTD